MAVADMHRRRPDDHRFGDAMAAADDQIEAFEIELLDEDRKQRQALAVIPAHAGQVLEQRVVDRRALDRRRDRAADVQQGEQLGAGIPLAQHLEHLLTAAHPGEPVVDDGYLHLEDAEGAEDAEG
jgi:hypothetical protein